MTRLSGRISLALAGMAIALSVTHMAVAQRGGGRGSRGGDSMFFSIVLASHEKVQSELNLTGEQKQQLAEIRDSMREKMRALREQGDGEGRGARRKIAEDAAAKLAEILDDDQEKRLAGILIQVDTGASLDDPYVAEQLNLTDEQKMKLEEARQANRRAMRETFAQGQDLSREERRAKMQELRTTAEENVKAVLTSEQQAKLEELKGEPVEIDRRELWRGRGNRGGQARQRGGETN
jgi:Spy/CpxP family protein refolding chaperone